MAVVEKSDNLEKKCMDMKKREDAPKTEIPSQQETREEKEEKDENLYIQELFKRNKEIKKMNRQISITKEEKQTKYYE